MYHVFSLHSLLEEHLYCFEVLVIVNKAIVMNIVDVLCIDKSPSPICAAYAHVKREIFVKSSFNIKKTQRNLNNHSEKTQTCKASMFDSS